jgi:hypothetical protein
MYARIWVFCLSLKKDHSKCWLMQKPEFLHLVLFPVKTRENSLKSGAKV